MSEIRIFVPRWMDASNTNAQNLNARALLSRFKDPRVQWMTTKFEAPDPAVASQNVTIKRLWRTRLWRTHMALLYQQQVDAVFYPGIEWFDDWGLRTRNSLRRVPVIGTLEGLAGDADRQKHLSTVVGHEVHFYMPPQKVMERIHRVLRSCEHVIAITPMLAKIGRALYGDKFSMLPLGIDGKIFHPRPYTGSGSRPRVVTVATLTERKRPVVMLEMAKQLPDIDFCWYGTGPLLERMRSAVKEQTMRNISFPGGLSPEELADEYARSDLFVLPSLSEGAPKALQEAAACGLPKIAFGYYEPQIVNGEDGYVVWSDEELRNRIERACDNLTQFRKLRDKRADNLSWDAVAPLWEAKIISQIQSLS